MRKFLFLFIVALTLTACTGKKSTISEPTCGTVDSSVVMVDSIGSDTIVIPDSLEIDSI